MESSAVEKIIRRLNDADVRYLIAGGFAVVAHGYSRYTNDLDLILDLEPENARQALQILEEEGYRPTIPVRIEEFTVPSARRSWLEDRNMVAFPLWSPIHPRTSIDVFIEEAVPFDVAYARRLEAEIAPGVTASFVALHDLLDLKQNAGRPKDLQDIYYLKAISTQRSHE